MLYKHSHKYIWISMANKIFKKKKSPNWTCLSFFSVKWEQICNSPNKGIAGSQPLLPNHFCQLQGIFQELLEVLKNTICVPTNHFVCGYHCVEPMGLSPPFQPLLAVVPTLSVKRLRWVSQSAEHLLRTPQHCLFPEVLSSGRSWETVFS